MEAGVRPMSCSSVGSAQSKMEYYLRAESRLSQVPKPDQDDNETKGQYAWRVIRHCVRDAIDLTMKADDQEMTITHGVQHGRKISQPHGITHMILNINTKEFITLDGKLLRSFHPDGRKKEVIEPEESFNRLIYASLVNLYLGWTHHETCMYLMTSEFEITSSCNALGPLLSVVYNDNIGEVVTAGAGFITSWVFRYGGRHLLPRKITQDGLTADDALSLLVLEQTASRQQRAFTSNGTHVIVLNLFEGRVLMRKGGLHTREITALLFFNPLKYLITAAKDGTIKVWDEAWHLQLVFVGHCAPVTSLAVYPYGPNIMSSSLDCTIRVWSLETCDEVDIIKTEDETVMLNTMINTEAFFSVSHTDADIWRINHVHRLHTRIHQKVSLIKVTDHPEHPLRNVLLCKDASVRITAPSNGDVITTLLMPVGRKLIDAAYAIAEDALFACFANGDIVKAYTGTNPCTVLEEWPCQDRNKICNYLLVYEYVISADVGTDTWGGIKRLAAASKGQGGGLTASSAASSPRSSSPRSNAGTTSAAGQMANANRTLLLGGRKDGHICVFNMDSGEVEFEIEAHGSKGVLSMMANSKADQLISAGLDNIIKVWRLYPYAQESLAPLMSFYCAHTPIHMTVLKNRLAVAFQEHTTATYSIVMYNLQGKNRSDHGPEDDHNDTITGLTSCNKMRLLASSSRDGSIRIWNELNVLLRVIRLNANPHSVSFCSHKGDLLVSIGDHVHHIDYKQYMPKSYRFKMVSMNLAPTEDDEALPYDTDLLDQLSKDDARRLKNARTSFKFTHFMDILTEEEHEDLNRETKLREKAYAKLAAREKEIEKIKDGEMERKKKAKMTKAAKTDAFNKYLDMFYTRKKFKLPKEEMFIEDKVKEMLGGGPPEVKDVYQPEEEPAGFFPGPSVAKKPKPETLVDPAGPPLRPDGLIPNSVLIRLLWPKEVTDENMKKHDEYRPPQITDDMLFQIDGERAKCVCRGACFCVALYGGWSMQQRDIMCGILEYI